jgi:hypothetical protein
VFRAHIERSLAPTLERGDTVIMDDLSTHKVYGVREAIESAGATLRYQNRIDPRGAGRRLDSSKASRSYLVQTSFAMGIPGRCSSMALATAADIGRFFFSFAQCS